MCDLMKKVLEHTAAQTALHVTFRNISVMDSRRGGELEREASDYAFQR